MTAICRWHFFGENVCILMQISVEFVPVGSIVSALVQVMARQLLDTMLLPETTLTNVCRMASVGHNKLIFFLLLKNWEYLFWYLNQLILNTKLIALCYSHCVWYCRDTRFRSGHWFCWLEIPQYSTLFSKRVPNLEYRNVPIRSALPNRSTPKWVFKLSKNSSAPTK